MIDPLAGVAKAVAVASSESEDEEAVVKAADQGEAFDAGVEAGEDGDEIAGDDDEDNEDDEDDESPVKGKSSGSAFALLGGDESGEDDESSDEDEAPISKGGSSAFALLMGDDGDDDDDDAESDAESDRGPKILIGKVASVAKHPTSSKLKVCGVFCGDDVGTKSIVTNVDSVEKEALVVVALAGARTPGSGMAIEVTKVRGVMSEGMMCSGYDLGWDNEADGVLARVPGSFAVGSACPESRPELSAEEVVKEKKAKKKKKGAAAIESAFAALGLEEEAGAVEKKKEKKKKKGLDFDALMAEATGDGGGAEAEGAGGVKPSASADKKGKKKGKKGGKKEAAEEEDLDAILAELGMEKEVAKEAPAEEPAKQQQQQQGSIKPTDESQMTAAQKKKAKAKARAKAKKAAAAMDASEDAEAPAPAASEPQAQAEDTKDTKPKKKVSAAVRRMQEALEAKKKADEEMARLEAEERAREEEEERLAAEEEARKKEEAERRKAEKAAKREQLKKEGKLLTAKQKAEQERLARVREQMLKAAGIDEAELAVKKKPTYGKKKGPSKKPSHSKSETEEAEKAAEAAKPPEPEPDAEPEAAAPEDEPVESWEEAADDWENMDEDDIKLPIGEEDELVKEEKAKAAAAAAAKAEAERKKAEQKASAGGRSDSDRDGDSDSGSESGDSSDYSSSDYSDSEYSDSDEEAERLREERRFAQREKEEARLREALANRNPEDLRSPICCILGHVDTGKTKILDNIRRTNVQDGEAGGITQQIGATYIPADALMKRTEELRKGREFDLKLPGLLVIDTPGHESFSNLRSRGSGLCDIAVLVVDLMHGLEQQTIESINLLKMRKTPFIIAMNKIDRIYQWNTVENSPIMDALDRQKPECIKEFEQRMAEMTLQLNEQGLNVALYWKNKNPRQFVNIVPTSAITGEGIPDLMQILVKMTQTLMVEKLMFVPNLQCTILEVKHIEGLGTTVDVILINGEIKEGDTIVVCGLNGPIVTKIRALLTPQPLREIRVKSSYVSHKKLRAASGIKIAANGLEHAVAGTQLFVVGEDDDIEAIKDEVMEDMQDIFSSVDKTGEGVCVQASTLGSLEALLEFLKSDDVQIPVASIAIGPVHKKDVMRANIMIERKAKKFGVILAFDVPVTKEAKELAEEMGVQIFSADIIYHLFDAFEAYLKKVKEEEQEAAKDKAVFPCVLRIMPEHIFNLKDPIIVGVEVLEGVARVGTVLCVPSRGKITVGKIAGLEKEKGKPLQKVAAGDTVAMKLEATTPAEAQVLFGRHFDAQDALVSRITRESIDVLKANFRDDMSKDEWRLIIRLKKMFNID